MIKLLIKKKQVLSKGSLQYPMSHMQATEGVDTIKEIHSNFATNYGVWYVKKGKRKSILKFQEGGAGGLAEVIAALDETKVSFHLDS